ncbi:PilZ domain-containing protein [uncultured Roseibium sp.]|uniref:PilZ domain-containing protein n=1 Tax=uncultured Roseibium sp. TaxID=1936171 RepID=UPI003217C660
MHGLAHLQDQDDITEEVLVIDFDNLVCIKAIVSNVSEWGCKLIADDVNELRKNIGIRVGNTGKLTKAQVTAVKGKEAAVVFPRGDTGTVQDKRRERRNKVSIPVKIADKEGITEISGTIVDAGQNGCRVSASGLKALPEEVMLTIKKFDKPVAGEFVWRNDNSAGLRLLWETVEAAS